MRRQFLLCLMMTAALFGVSSCNDKTDEFDDPGTSSIISLEGPSTAFMGDSISFSFDISSTGVRLNQSKVQLFYGETIVSERIMLTPKEGQYSGKILIPFMKNIPDGTVNVKLRIQNERFAHAELIKDIAITRPNFSKLILRGEDGKTYDMLPVAGKSHTYAVTDDFPSEYNAKIEAPKYGTNGNTMVFGTMDSKITNGVDGLINFEADNQGYEITFNTLTYEGTPFIKFAVNDVEFEKIDDNKSKVEMEFTQGQDINITGLKADYANYWINPAFFDIVKNTNGKTLRFRARTGKYRLTVDKSLKYFKVDVMNGNALADLSSFDVLWCVGDGNIGFPSYSKNKINWSTANAICLAPMGDKRHEIVLQKGVTINTVNYKFYGNNNWGNEFVSTKISLGDTNPWFKVNSDPSNNGNINASSTTLVTNYYYRVIVDLSGGNSNAKLYATEVVSIPEVE